MIDWADVSKAMDKGSNVRIQGREVFDKNVQ